ncbi:MAG: DUF3109 family protein [Anaerolineaceae bacterium]|nr:DUF3109 family protein [Anaerolineaceae bacterium]
MNKDFELNPRMLISEKMQRCKLIDCQGECCVYGVWVGLQDRDIVLKHQEIKKKLMPDNFKNSQDWFQKKILRDPFIAGGEVIHTSVIKNSANLVGTACVFLNDHHKCVLQITAEKIGLHKWNLKPFYCILHPLDLDDAGRITLDETDSLLSENGSCLRFSQEKISLLSTFEEELLYLLGFEEYQNLLNINKSGNA